MSKTNDTSNVDHRELTIDELDAVSGGSPNGGNVTAGWDMAKSSGPMFPPTGGGGNDAGPAIAIWNTLLGQYGAA